MEVRAEVDNRYNLRYTRKKFNLYADAIYERLLAQEVDRLKSISDVVYDKVKEVEKNRNAVFKSFIKEETANTQYLKSCIAE